MRKNGEQLRARWWDRKEEEVSAHRPKWKLWRQGPACPARSGSRSIFCDLVHLVMPTLTPTDIAQQKLMHRSNGIKRNGIESKRCEATYLQLWRARSSPTAVMMAATTMTTVAIFVPVAPMTIPVTVSALPVTIPVVVPPPTAFAVVSISMPFAV